MGIKQYLKQVFVGGLCKRKDITVFGLPVPLVRLFFLSMGLWMLLKPLYPIIEYINNYDYIVEVLCENTDRPTMQCDGKCYLAKLLAEETEHTKNPFAEKTYKYEIHQIFSEVETTDFPNLIISIKSFIDPKMSHGLLWAGDWAPPPELYGV